MTSRTVLKAFLFTDIVGATELKNRLGDAAGAEAIARHDALFRGCLERYGGREHENPGDGFFASFPLPSDALRCALSFQEGLARLDTPVRLQARAGLHMGESVLLSDSSGVGRHDKLLGLAVDTAARVMGMAQAGQILLTRHAFDSVRQQVVKTDDGTTIQWRAHGRYELKGIRDAVEVFESGIPGISTLTPPPDSANARRAVAPGEEAVLGWRPAIGHAVPSREAWILERKLGEGAFGEVWLARHIETRYVRAFKFCFHPDRLRSLKRELKLFRLLAEVLGDRPDIARLYEVRLSDAPYFLEMEYTPGGNLAEWAETFGGVHNVPLATRLGIVAQLGDALAAAHSVGIIHKDLKPNNVLIHEERDKRIQARLTDFGIGELVDKQRLVEFGMTVTAFDTVTEPRDEYGSLTGTQLYLAPELLGGDPPSIRTDVYALGVLLYQLVVGDLKRPIAHGWERDVEDEVLRGDIAACVAGLPQNRLPSADALSQRLRSLDARRAALRAERRRRALLRFTSAGSAVLALLALVSGVGLWQVELARRDAVDAEERTRVERDRARAAEERAEVERDRAREQAARLERLTTFLQEMLASVDPFHARGREVTVRDVLEDTAGSLDSELADDPTTAAAIHDTLGRTYFALGDYETAERHLRRALGLYTSVSGPESRHALRTEAELAFLQLQRGETAGLEARLERVLAAQRSLLGPVHPDVLIATNVLAGLLETTGEFARAEQLQRWLVKERTKALGRDHRDTMESRNNLAGVLHARGALDEAETIYRDLLNVQLERYGEPHPHTLTTMNNLAAVCKARGHLAEAEDLRRRALDNLRSVVGEEHPLTFLAMNNLAAVLVAQERYAEAEPLYRDAIDALGEQLGSEHPNVLGFRNNLADLLRRDGRLDEALPVYEELVVTAARALPVQHPYLAAFRGNYGEALVEAGRYEQAEPQLLAALDDAQALYAADHANTREALDRLVRLYERWQRPEQAAPYRERLAADAVAADP